MNDQSLESKSMEEYQRIYSTPIASSTNYERVYLLKNNTLLDVIMDKNDQNTFYGLQINLLYSERYMVSLYISRCENTGDNAKLSSFLNALVDNIRLDQWKKTTHKINDSSQRIRCRVIKSDNIQ